jgi:hypothetical protein
VVQNEYTLKARCIFLLILLPELMKAQAPATWYEGKIQEEVYAITEVLLHDIVNPPAASRFYAYTILSGYELLSLCDSNAQRLRVNGLPAQEAVSPMPCDARFAALYCMLETARGMLPSGFRMEEKLQQLAEDYRKVQPNSVITDSSIAFAKRVAKSMIDYSRTDGYFALSTKPRYKPGTRAGDWSPTPPEYMSAVEPNWTSIRPFFLDSCSQFKPLPVTSFDVSKSSPFYALAYEVYQSVNNLSKEQLLIANFWDCNPFAVQFEGHMSIGLKKISPGGHWMGITGIVCAQEKLSFARTLFIHAVVACSLHDAFICCWDEKYRSNRIRPETVINRYIDEKWKPVLQTPPFPEYTSGHSVISTTAAEVLTYFLGNSLAFTDSTEMYIGLPARRFSSFRTASDEACISRLYGGIHYRDAIENGREQGLRIAQFILQRLSPSMSKTN